ncbi:MAG: hypothetical protein K0R10_2166 [Alphaproteobacteria bacterium]|jgi:hypothetical protein|nr:hypothetical protein [Alphaproteobacteria bacterium]
MAKKKTDSAQEAATPAAPAKSALDAIRVDEYAGQGGSYLFDPATGKRTPITEEDLKNG